MGANVEMHLGPPGPDVFVRLEGRDITPSLRGISLQMGNAGLAPELTLDLHCPSATVNGVMQVLLSDDTQALLLSLGWTPPA